jgi:membrane-associated HD superfamily phosphohydrolase
LQVKSSSIEEAEKTERQQAEAKAAARIVLTQTVHAAAAALNVADQLLKAIAKALCGSKSTTEEASSSGHSLAGRIKL